MENASKLPLGGFKCVEGTSQFNEDFSKIYNEDSDIKFYLEVQYPKEVHDFA